MKKLSKGWKRYGYILLLYFIIIGIYDMRLVLPAIVCMIGPVLLAAMGKGRYWCKNICPRGILMDYVLLGLSRRKPVPWFMKLSLFRILILILFFYIFWLGTCDYGFSTKGVGHVLYRMILMTTSLGLIVGVMYHQRAWCIFCPMGTLATFVSKIKRKKVKR